MKLTSSHFKYLLLLGGAISATLPISAHAQETNKYNNDEIIVTATKRSENLQDVPLSVTAFNEVKIEQLRPDNLSDLADHVPNMYLPPANESASQYITLRGLGAGVTRSGGRSVGVYIDGVYTSADNLTNLPVSDLASLEVLKGPQGTLFGRDTVGGAINVTTKKPGNEFSGFLEADVGNYGRTVFTGGVDLPLAKDKLFLRVSGKKLNYGGHIDNIFNGEKADGQDQFSGRAQFYFTPTDAVDARLVFTHSERDDNPTTGENAGGTFSDQIPYQVNINVQESFKQKADSIALSVNYELGSGHMLTSVTGWNRSSDVSLVDRDLNPLPESTQSILYDVEDLTQEFRITSPQNDKFDYLVGLYYLDSHVVNRDTYPLFGAAWLANIGFPPILPDVLDGQERDFTTKALAGFAHGNYHFNDKLSVFGGLRYTSDKKDINHTTFGEVFGAFGFISANRQGKTEETPFTWSAGVRYAASDALKTYASVSTGYRSPSIKDDFITAADVNPLTADGFATEPEFVTNYEVGAKYRGLDNRLSANVAVFYMNYTDIQVSVAVPPLLFVRQLRNAGKAHIQGFEADASFAITDNLNISGSAGYLKTEYDEFEFSHALEGTGFGTAPEWSLDGAIDYHTPIGNLGELVLHLDATTIAVPDDFAPNGTALTLGGFSTVNAFAAIDSASGRWRASLWAKNLLGADDTTGTTLWGAGLGPNEHNVFIYQNPRTYGATLRVNFD